MKKHAVILAVCIIMAATAGSVWEGAAAVTSNGELPESGYYAASSSFPRNTVVDVTNLETRKTVRVIIASPLESPGLLALLSRDAAGAIGLSSRSVGRIRITQPADSVAFSRFTEGAVSGGDPDFDPRAAVAANYPHLLEPADTGTMGEAEGQYPKTPSSLSGPYTDMTIVDIPAGGLPQAAPEPDADIAQEPEAAWVFPEEPDDETIDGTAGEGEPVLAGAAIQEPDLPEYIPPGEPVLAEEGIEYTPDAPEYAEDYFEFSPEITETPPETSPVFLFPADEPVPGEAPVSNMTSEYTFVPAGERPPDALPPEILPAVEPIAPFEPSSEPSSTDLSPAAPAPLDGTLGVFPVPLITQLERGKYYLQLGAYSYTESVEAELSRLGNTYPLSVQSGDGHPLYRILVGPVNMGECGALLQRFKTIGYTDAFIRLVD